MEITENNYKPLSMLVFILITISVFLSYAIVNILEIIKIKVPFYVEIPSVGGIYSLIFWVFNNYLWKYDIFRILGIITVDNLEGEWEGVLKSSYDNFVKDIPAKLTIHQKATSIRICGQFNQSKSVSLNAGFGYSGVEDKTALFYFYRNEPNFNAPQTMAMHEGSVKLIYNKDSQSLEGSYYSGRDRNNYGTITLRRKL